MSTSQPTKYYVAGANGRTTAQLRTDGGPRTIADAILRNDNPLGVAARQWAVGALATEAHAAVQMDEPGAAALRRRTVGNNSTRPPAAQPSATHVAFISELTEAVATRRRATATAPATATATATAATAATATATATATTATAATAAPAPATATATATAPVYNFAWECLRATALGQDIYNYISKHSKLPGIRDVTGVTTMRSVCSVCFFVCMFVPSPCSPVTACLCNTVLLQPSRRVVAPCQRSGCFAP